jgi:hypothetical protein
MFRELAEKDLLACQRMHGAQNRAIAEETAQMPLSLQRASERVGIGP